jgi:hypothetical protein
MLIYVAVLVTSFVCHLASVCLHYRLCVIACKDFVPLCGTLNTTLLNLDLLKSES